MLLLFPTFLPRRRSSKEKSAFLRLSFTDILISSVETFAKEPDNFKELDSDSEDKPQNYFDASLKPTAINIKGLILA